MSVKNIIDAALNKARSTAGGTEKVASGKTDGGSLIKEAQQVADALEYMAGAVVDDGTPSGEAQRRVVEEFFKGADTTAIKGPAQSVSPTGTQATPPQAGAKKILPTGQAGGTHPAESVAPTGTQATIGQPPGGEKKADRPLTLLDMLTKQAMDMGPGNEPKNSEALQDTADPGSRNENRNVGRALGSNEGPVNLTKRDAKAPTRDRLKALFASATDTGPSSAAAKAAFPNAYAKGGMKVAEAKCEKCGKEPCECKVAEKKGAFIPGPQERAANRAAAGAMEGQATLTGDAAQADTMAGHGAGAGAVYGAHGGLAGGMRAGGRLGALYGGILGGGAGAAAGVTEGAAHGGIPGALLGGGIGLLGGGLGGAMVGGGAGALLGGAAGVPAGYVQGMHEGGQMGHEDAQTYLQARRAAIAADAAAAQGKTASAILSDYATLFDKAAAGELGPEARAFAEYIEQVQV